MTSATTKALPAAEGQRPPVRVTGLEVFRVHVNRLGNWVICRLQTDSGVTGIGDASHAGRGDPQAAKLQEYFEIIRGRSVFDVEWFRGKLHGEMDRLGKPASAAFSGIEQALYDIQGQVLGVPCYQLFGGKLRDSVRSYANINRSTEQRAPAGFAAMAESARQAGFDAVKLAPFDGMPRNRGAEAREAHTKLGVDSIAAVRQAIGQEADLLVDAHSNFTLEEGIELARRLEPLNLFWLEEVCRSWGDLASLNAAVSMPTAGGESLYGLRQNREYIGQGAVDILMPDVKFCAGMLQLKKIAALAEAASMPVAPHGPASPVGNVSAAHVCAGMPNFLILEHSHGEVPWRAELIDPPEPLEKGHLQLSSRPGLGIRLNERTATQHRAED